MTKEEGGMIFINRNQVMDLESPEIYSVKDLQQMIREVFPRGDNGSAISMLIQREGIQLHLLESDSINPKIIRQEDVYAFKTLKEVIL